jgi:hypothetical protein
MLATLVNSNGIKKKKSFQPKQTNKDMYVLIKEERKHVYESMKLGGEDKAINASILSTQTKILL